MRSPSKYEELLSRIESLQATLDEFIQKYEEDMRGDKNVSNGNKGIVGAIRDLQAYIQTYPSLLYLLHREPLKALSILIASWLTLAILYDLGRLEIISRLFGLHLK